MPFPASLCPHSLRLHRDCPVQEGSEYHTLASRLKAIFEERYAKYVRDDGAWR